MGWIEMKSTRYPLGVGPKVKGRQGGGSCEETDITKTGRRHQLLISLGIAVSNVFFSNLELSCLFRG